jgi:hypothetical protein
VCFADICLLLKPSVMLLALFLWGDVDVTYHPHMLCIILCYNTEGSVLLIYFLRLIYMKLDTQHLMNTNTVKINITLSFFVVCLHNRHIQHTKYGLEAKCDLKAAFCCYWEYLVHCHLSNWIFGLCNNSKGRMKE